MMAGILIAAPDGSISPQANALAVLPEALTGLRIAVLENRKPNARHLLDSIARAVAARTGMRVSAVEAKVTAASPAAAELLANLRLRADVILTGSGD
jgi:hypothetical protein